MTVGDERTHAQLLRQPEGLLIGDGSITEIWGVVSGRDLAGKPAGSRLIAPLVALTRKSASTLRVLGRIRTWPASR
jgi:hypothetical protein